MKALSLIIWVTQFGLSILLPPCFFLWLGHWLQNRFGLGVWVSIILGILGLLVAFSTAKTNLKSMLKDADAVSDRKDPPPLSFNNHN